MGEVWDAVWSCGRVIGCCVVLWNSRILFGDCVLLFDWQGEFATDTFVKFASVVWLSERDTECGRDALIHGRTMTSMEEL